MLTVELEELLVRVEFAQARAARARLADLAGDTAGATALARVAPGLGHALELCPDPDRALNNLDRFLLASGARWQLFGLFADHPALLEGLVQVLASSQYLADVLVRNPEYFEILSDTSALAAPRTPRELEAEIDATCAAFASPEAKLDAVRRFRRRAILQIGVADLRGVWDLPPVAQQLSHLADVVVAQCLRIVAAGSDTAGLIVYALGKLGGAELNYSSDIDLIFVTHQPERIGAATRLAQALTHALGDTTGEGFLYRVDLRLRPWGSSGALVVSTGMFEDYLTTKAHPAERQAMLKARAIAGDVAAGNAFLQRIVPILFGDPPSARQQVRELKDRIERQLRSRGESDGHVKLAPGGIRDVEFIVQALQLEAASSRAGLRSGNTLDALVRLADAGVLAAQDAHELRESYVFLRTVEHRLQLMDNQQVHHLPRDAAELRHLARTMGFGGPEEAGQLRTAYETRSQAVRRIFERILAPPPEESAAPPVEPAKFEAIATQLGTAYDRFDERARRCHVELLERIRSPADVAVDAQPLQADRWTVTVCAVDHVGLLSVISGLFTAWRMDICSGDVFTLRFEETDSAGPAVRMPVGRARRPGARPRRVAARTKVTRKILDIFQVRPVSPTGAESWQAFRHDLAELVALVAARKMEAARERIVDRVSQAVREATGPDLHLFPVQVEVHNDTTPALTELRIFAVDTLGFLFEFTAALAVLNINIERVEIRTVDRAVRDTFWVTDAYGNQISDPQRIHELRVAAVLIKQFTHLLPRSPNPAQALRQFSSMTGQMLSRPEWVSDLGSLDSDAVLRTLAELMGVSQFLWEDFLRIQHENLFPVVRDLPALDQVKSPARLREELECQLAGAADGADRASRINQFRDREMFRIDLRHITQRIGFVEFSAELSDLAQVVVERASRLCDAELQEQFGEPRLVNGHPCRWCVCALGKFGGRELGFASDIELLFVYEHEGSTSGHTPIENSRYFEELVSSLLRTLSARREGIFEIDLRLRPHGKAGSLACSRDGFAQYFSEQGAAQQFERMALVKLRPVAGDPALGAEIAKARDAFVYSGRPLDPDNIRHLRRRQATELVPYGCTSAKHSPGGLVDVEYFVQSKQIEFGHADASVREANTLEAIDRLARGGHLAAELARELGETYGFLRRLIDALRVVRGHAKDLTIPPADSREFAYLARRLQYDSPDRLGAEIAQRMRFARKLWENWIANKHQVRVENPKVEL